MTEHDKPSTLPAPVSLTLKEAMQVAGGGSIAEFLDRARFDLEHIHIGRPAISAVQQTPLVVTPAAVSETSAF